MSNRERGNYEGAIHHVWQRGNNKDFIFEDDKTKSFFIKQLKEYNKKFDYNILAYVIMNNHYHLLIQTFNDPISKIMFNINNVTGKFIRDNLNRSGHVFQGRYNSRLVQTNQYFLWLIRYIHRNPLRAKICNNVQDYNWSSHHLYLSKNHDFVNVDYSLSIFNSDRKKAFELYLNLMNSNGCEESDEKDFELLKPQLNEYNGNQICSNLNSEPALPRTSIKEIVSSFNLQPEVIHLLTSGCRKRYLTNIKICLAKKALKQKYTLSEISSYFCTTESAISKLINEHK